MFPVGFLDVGNFYRCRLQIPQNFGSEILANLPTRVPLCLLNNAKAPVGMTDFKIKRIFWGIGNFYRCRLQILANLSGKHFGWNGISGPGLAVRSFAFKKRGVSHLRC